MLVQKKTLKFVIFVIVSVIFCFFGVLQIRRGRGVNSLYNRHRNQNSQKDKLIDQCNDGHYSNTDRS